MHVKLQKKKLRSCLKGKSTKIIPDKLRKKSVHFNPKILNDESLDSDMRERIEHNLKYNDDTIFDNISIFRDLNNSGVVFLPKKLSDKKDIHPSRLTKKYEIEEDEDEEGLMSPIHGKEE